MTDTNAIRVLFVLPSLERGGAETQTINVINGLDPTIYKKHVGVFSTKLPQKERLKCETTIHIAQRKNKLDYSAILYFARVIDRFNIDIVHCSLQMAVFMGVAATLLSKKKPRLVAAIHTTVNRHTKNDIADRLVFSKLLGRCNKIVFVCHAQLKHWIAKYPNLTAPSCVIYNGVDTRKFDSSLFRDTDQDLRKVLGIPPTAKVVTCVAQFRPEKGHHYLVEAFSRLTGDPHLILAGDGDLRPDLENAIRARGIDKRVHFLGDVSDVREVLSISEITVLASTSVETFSIAMLESMAMGVPVIATDIGGLSEAIETNVNGELVTPGDATGLHRAMQRVLTVCDLAQMGRNAREKVVRNFSEPVMVSATADVLHSLSNPEK